MDIRLETARSYKELLRVLGGVKSRLLQQIAGMPKSETKKLKWMRTMTAEVDRIIDGKKTRTRFGGIRIELLPLAKRLSEPMRIAQVFSAGVRDGLEEVGIYRDFPLLDKKAVEFLQGYSFDLIKGLTEEMRTQVKSQIRLGIIQGESVPEMMKRLINEGLPRGAFPKTADRAERIVRTELARAHTEGRLYYYREVGVKKVKVIGKGFDCPICSQHINHEYEIAEAPHVPFHPNCQCDIVAIVNEGKSSA